MITRDRFEAIRKRYLAAREREQTYRETVLLKRYGKMKPPSYWLTRTEEKRLDSFDRAADKAMDAMFVLLDDISPRYWRAGVAAWWVLEELSYDDAVTTGTLSVVPQAGYGSSVREAEQFAQAVA